jgi:tetratricopeptide (TPR) repeat protein
MFEEMRHVLRGRVFQWLRHHDAALAAYQDAVRANPRSFASTARVAYLLAQRGRLPEAEAFFERALALRPDDADTMFNLGFVRHRQHKEEHAVTTFREAVRLNPAQDRAWYGMGVALRALARHDEAIAAQKEAARLQPMSPHAWYELGMAHHALGHDAEVKKIIARIEEFDPRMTVQLKRDTGNLPA